MSDAIDLITATQDALFVKLAASVPPELAAVYQHVPDEAAYPYIVIGKIEAENIGTKADPEERHVVEIVSLYEGPGRDGLLALMHAVKLALDEKPLTAPGVAFGDPHWLESVADGITDEDTGGVTYVGLQTFELTAEPAA